MYLHWLTFPLFVDWKKGGERFGFRAGSIIPFTIITSDGKSLGAWHVLPIGKEAKRVPPLSTTGNAQSLADADLVFLYFHGNAGNRATYHRTNFYKILTRLPFNSHVISIDYRGFGNSTPEIPTEKTLRIDALSTFDWIVSQGVRPDRIVIVGHSLGSGVAADLAYILSKRALDEKKSSLFRGLVLVSGYASIADAAIGYPNVPLLRPFHGSPALEKFMKSMIKDKLESHRKLPSISAPVLLLHGARDTDIQPWQAKANFLEALGGRMGKQLVDRDGFWALRDKQFSPENIDGMTTRTLPGDEGVMWIAEKSKSTLWLLLVNWGSHNNLAIHQVVQDTIESWILDSTAK